MTLETAEQHAKSWFEGFHEGEKSVFQFLVEMGKVKEIDEYQLQEEYKGWSNADEYTKANGEVIKRYE